jgi:cell pole-organizing protein PopZ
MRRSYPVLPPQANQNVLRTLTARVQTLEGKMSSMSLVLTNIQTALAGIQAIAQKLAVDVPAAIQAAAAGADEATNQAAIDSITASLTSVSTSLTNLDTSLTPPAAPAAPVTPPAPVEAPVTPPAAA